jgi:hypothetical protein
MSAYTTVPMLQHALDLDTIDQATRELLGALIVRVSAEFDTIMGFTFDAEYRTVTMDGPGASKLYLPAPGAADVGGVVENDVILDPLDYELEPIYGRFLLRLDGANKETWWTTNGRAIVVQYTPNLYPPDLEEYCIRECVRSWQGRAAGYPDVVGVEASNERRYTRAFAPGTVRGLQALSAHYGIRNLVAM